MIGYWDRFRKKTELPDMQLRIAGIVRESIVDGPGMRFVVFVQGCPHHCEGCHNPQTHDFNGGKITTLKAIYEQIEQTPMVSGITFSGGEPFCQAEALAALGKRLREDGKDIMTYSGFTYEKLLEKAKTEKGVDDLLRCTNILVDGPFVLSKRNILLKFRGSENQRVLDITCYPNSAEAQEIEF